MKKYILIGVLLIIFFVAGIPLLVATFAGGNVLSTTEEAEEPGNKIDVPKTIDVWLEDEGKCVEVDFEDYVTRVTASEMPAVFDIEALKAQSVAARTYSMAKVKKYEETKPNSHPEAPVCNTIHCQVYKTEEQLFQSHEDGWKEEGWEKIKEACTDTRGQLLYYEGDLVMQPLFFSSSGGQTENSEDVFSGAYPYLVSVSSPYEEGASHSNEEKTFTLREMEKVLTSTYVGREPGTLTSSNVKILSRTAGGRVEKMQVGNVVYKGTEMRNALGLSSALFNISFEESEGLDSQTQIVFTSNGYGHGVGMSQYGANGMAKEGKNYKEILTHYYTGTKVY